MLVRTSEGEIIIILRKNFDSEKTYNKKIYKIMSKYIDNKNSIIIPPIEIQSTNKLRTTNNNLDDEE
jgi:hypothetical protein